MGSNNEYCQVCDYSKSKYGDFKNAVNLNIPGKNTYGKAARGNFGNIPTGVNDAPLNCC